MGYKPKGQGENGGEAQLLSQSFESLQNLGEASVIFNCRMTRTPLKPHALCADFYCIETESFAALWTKVCDCWAWVLGIKGIWIEEAHFCRCDGIAGVVSLARTAESGTNEPQHFVLIYMEQTADQEDMDFVIYYTTDAIGGHDEVGGMCSRMQFVLKRALTEQMCFPAFAESPNLFLQADSTIVQHKTGVLHNTAVRL